MEIRWQQSKENVPVSRPADICKQLQKELQQPVIEVPLPPSLQSLDRNYQTVGLSWLPDGQLSGLIAVCPVCGILVFCRFFPHKSITADELVGRLDTIQCHATDATNATLTSWNIQDLALRLPAPFRLIDYTFAAGLTRLSFCNEPLHLQTCRLAQAAERLTLNNLEDILRTLHGRKDTHCHTTSDGLACECWCSPSITRQAIIRLGRKKPFLWSRIWHLPDKDRLLAIILESTRPIPADTSCLICEHYEIVQ
jgi:hypothetical protein